MLACKRWILETLRSQPYMTQNLPGHCPIINIRSTYAINMDWERILPLKMDCTFNTSKQFLFIFWWNVVISIFGPVKSYSSITTMIPHLCKNCFKLLEMGMLPCILGYVVVTLWRWQVDLLINILRATSHMRVRAYMWPLHFKHSHWWKRRRWSKFASHYTWGTNGVCECKMDVKSTWIPTWHRMDHVSWSLGLFSKTISWR